MKKAFTTTTFFMLLIIFFISNETITAQETEILENSTVVEMVHSGIPVSLIIRKIQTSPNRFDVSMNSIVELTNREVPEEVIAAMMDSEKNRVSVHHELTKKLGSPGIFYVQEGNLDGKIVILEPSLIDNTKEGSFGSHMAGALTAAARTKVKAIINGASANMHVHQEPLFIFYFGDGKEDKEPSQPVNPNDPVAMMQALSNLAGGVKIEFSQIGSPNEIRLIKTEVGRRDRSFVASSSSGMVRESGIDSDFIVEFQFERLADGLYRVTPQKPLLPGEYLFVFAGSRISQGHYVYDFSVK